MTSDPSKHSTQTESNLLDVLDHPRSEDGYNDQQYGQLNHTISASFLSLAECEGTLDSVYHLKESEEQKCTKTDSKLPKIEGEELKTLTHYSEDIDSEVAVTSGSRVEFHQISLTSSNLRLSQCHDDMTKPLLERR